MSRRDRRAVVLRVVAAAFALLCFVSVAAADAPPQIVLTIEDGATADDGTAALPPVQYGGVETVTADDEPTLLTAISLGAGDGGTISDQLKLLLGLELPVGDGATVGDAVTILPAIPLATGDGATTTDVVRILPSIPLPVGDGATVGDTATIRLGILLGMVDAAHVNDDVALRLGILLGAGEQTTVGDAAAIVLGTRTTLTASANPVLAHEPETLTAHVSAAGGDASGGSVTFDADGSPLGPPVPVDANGVATLTTTSLDVGTHTIHASYGGTGDLLSSRDSLSLGVYDYTVDVQPPTAAVLAGASAHFTVTTALVAGSPTNGLPADVPLSVTGLPPGASSSSLPTIPLVGSVGVTLDTVPPAVGSFTVEFHAGARSATAQLGIWDYTLALAPASVTVQRGGAASFTVSSSLVPGSAPADVAAISLSAATGTFGGTLALPGTTTYDVPTDAATPPGDELVTVTGAPGARVATAHLYVNDPPVPVAGTYAGAEGTPIPLHATADDADHDTLTYSWDLNGDGVFETDGASPSLLVDDGPAVAHPVVRVCDDHGACATDTATVSVANVAPTATLVLPPNPVAEGSTFTLSLKDVHDPSQADTAAGFVEEFDCGAGWQSSPTCRALDNPGLDVKARITDKDGGSTTYTATVPVSNVAPSVSISAPADNAVVFAGVPVTFTGVFSDPGPLDTETFAWSFGASTLGASYAFPSAGFFTVTLTVTDKDGGVGTAAVHVIVVDPAAGFVTGAGWLGDSRGARTFFAFAAKYHGQALLGDVGLVTPVGAFAASSLRFLVVTGSTFVLDGTGWLNLRGGYHVRLDGEADPDRLRVRLWAPSGALVYDSGGPRALGGGQIQIHHAPG